MANSPAPQIEIVGELSEAAIESLASLLIHLAEADAAAATQEDTSAAC